MQAFVILSDITCKYSTVHQYHSYETCTQATFPRNESSEKGREEKTIIIAVAWKKGARFAAHVLMMCSQGRKRR